jgi:hypothetical protein
MYPFIWIPNTSDGTISLIATQTVLYHDFSLQSGKEYGRYRTCPLDVDGQPSRITIDLEGNCWVANMYSDTLVKILNRFISPLKDISDPSDGIQTSLNGTILNWGTDDCVVWEINLRDCKENSLESEIKDKDGNSWKKMTHRPSSVRGSNAYTVSSLSGIRAIATDKNNNIWAGTYNYEGRGSLYQIKYETSSDEKRPYLYWKKTDPAYSAFGAVIDRKGIIYFALHNGGMLKVNPSIPGSLTDKNNHPYYVSKILSIVPGTYEKLQVYGIALDNTIQNRIYTTDYDHKFLYRWDIGNWTDQKNPTFVRIATKTCFKGIAVSNDGIWVANTTGNKLELFSKEFTSQASFIASIVLTDPAKNVRYNPFGVSIDSEGNCWVVGINSPAVESFRYNNLPKLAQVGRCELPGIIGTDFHNTYSDLTGYTSN